MKSFRASNVIVAAVCLAISAMSLMTVNRSVIAQFKPQGTIIQGVTSGLAVVPVQVDASGVLQTNASISGGVDTVNISGVTPISGALPTTYSGTQSIGNTQFGISGVAASSG